MPVSLHQRDRKWQICEKFSTNRATAGLLVSISLISDVKCIPSTSAVLSVLSTPPFSSRRSSGLASRTALRYRMSLLFSSSDSSNPDSDSAPETAAASGGSGGQRSQRRPAGATAASGGSGGQRAFGFCHPSAGRSRSSFTFAAVIYHG